MMYGSETWGIKKTQEKRMDVAEMRMLRWSLGLTRKDKVRNEIIRERMGVRPVSEKIQGARLRWFGHVERRGEGYVGKIADRIQLQGKRKRGRPRTTWTTKTKDDLKMLGVNKELAQNRDEWRKVTLKADPRASGTTSST